MVVLAFALFGSGVPVQASDPSVSDFHHTTWTAADGAPRDTWAIAQTSDGWMWFGGPSGLYRFDGVRFERRELDGNSSRSGSTSALLALASGELLIGLRGGGIGVLQHGRYTHFDDDQTRLAQSVLGFAQDAQGTLWAACSGGLLRFDGSAWKLVGSDWNVAGGYVGSVFADHSGTLWIATRNEILRLRDGSHRFEPVRLDAGVPGDFFESPDGRVWIGAESGPYLLPDQTPRHRLDKRANSRTSYSALFDRQGYLWCWWTTPGASLAMPSVRDVSSLGTVKTVMEDRDGNLWFGDQRAIVHRLSRPRIRKVSNVPSGPSGFDWAGVAADADGGMWLELSNGRDLPGTDGLWHYDRKLERMQRVDIKGGRALHRDSTGTVWAAGLGSIWRLVGDEFVRAVPLSPMATGARVMRIMVDAAGSLWVAVEGFGLQKRLGDAWIRNGNLPDLPDVMPTVMSSGTNGRFFLGYSNGSLAIVAPAGVVLLPAEQGPRLGAITAINIGRRTLIAGEGGLVQYIDGSFRKVDSNDARAFDGVSGIVEMENGDVWLHGSRGIVHLKDDDLAASANASGQRIAIEIFDDTDGYPVVRDATPGPLPTLARASDGVLWFAGQAGIGVLDPSDALTSRNPPRPEILSLSVGGTRRGAENSAVLDAGTRDIRIAYTALSYSHPDRVRFRYRLEGVDNAWNDVDAGANREASYSNLGPGVYRFLVSTTDERARWTEAPATLTVTIPPTFLESRWFTAVCVVLAAAIVIVLYRFRVGQVTARERGRLQERVAERERIARELHDTLLQSVQGLVFKFDAVLRDLPLEPSARGKLNRALASADQVIVESRNHIQGLRSSLDPADDLQTALAGIATEAAGNSAVRVGMVTEGVERPLAPRVFEAAYRIGREALSNAFQHAGAKVIEVQLLYADTDFRMRIRDDGVGFAPLDHKAQSPPGHWGLTGMSERAEQVGAQLILWSRKGAGTEVEFVVPASLAYESKMRRLP